MKVKASHLTIVFVALLGSTEIYSQSNEIFDQLTGESIILSEKGIIRGENDVQTFITASGLKGKSYQKKFDIEVNRNLSYEIGEVQSQSESHSVMLVKKKNAASAEIEFLVIFKKSSPTDDAAGIDKERTRWMELCNAHQANELVKELYTDDALYYNRGRLLQGTKAISAEYGYMNSPSYSLKLTPKHITFVTDKIAYEIGQCSGSYPLPYMLLWEKQEDGSWQVSMDSNF